MSKIGKDYKTISSHCQAGSEHTEKISLIIILHKTDQQSL